MATDSSSVLCFNFEQLEKLRGITGDFDLAILYGQLKFQVNKSKITNKKTGVKEIARTRLQVANGIGKGVTVTMEKLTQLIGMGLVDKRIGMWKGIKRMFLSCNGEYELGVNARKLEMLNKYTGGIHQSVLLSWIAYWIEVRPYRGKDHKYTLVSRKRAAKLLGVDERTVDTYMADLVARGLINYDGRKRKFWDEWQYHVSLNKDFMNKIDIEWQELEEKRAKEKAESLLFRAKTDGSIKVNKNHQVEIINNNTKEYANHPSVTETPLVDEKGIVILSKRQQNYLAEAIRRTLARCDVLTWSYETLMGHMRYALGTPKNRENGQGFAHIINRAMFLVRDGRWCVPFGYFKYTDEGRSESDRLRAFEQKELSYKPKEAIERLKQQGDERVYEKDEDYGNVWAAKKLAAELKSGDIRHQVPEPTPIELFTTPYTNPLVRTKTHRMVDSGAKEFESHEDVMAKLLGKI